MGRTLLNIALVCLLTAIALFGCGDRPEQWGVVLWSTNEDLLPSGSLVGIYENSQLNGTYTYRPLDAQTSFQTEQWRVEAFRKRRDAEGFAAEYERWSDRFAVSELDGLRVRARPDADSAQMYKLREEERIKIVGRTAEPTKVGEHEGYWYEVLTTEGVRGYTFDEFLAVRTLEELANATEQQESDPFLEQLYTTVYRPEYFREMHRTGRYDLDRFLPAYGLTVDHESRQVRIVLEDHQVTIDYERVTRPTDNSYAFEESSLILTRNPKWINLIYSHDGTRYSRNFVHFQENIGAVVDSEIERRQAVYEELRSNGPILESSAYGTIELLEDQVFEWEGFGRLVPGVISTDPPAGGRVEFPLYLDDAASQDFDGALVFAFRDESGQVLDRVRFVYAFAAGGIRFNYAPESAVEENLIHANNLSSVILFFTFS